MTEEWIAIDAQTASEIAKNVAQVGAMGAAGLWTYRLFIKGRQKWPRASLEHAITHRTLDDSKILLRVMVGLTNTGSVLLSLAETRTYVQNILPLDEGMRERLISNRLVEDGQFEADWPLIDEHHSSWAPGEVEIEPGEGDQFNHDFILDKGTGLVLVYSYVGNSTKKDGEIGWPLSTLYDLEEGAVRPRV